MKPIRCLLRCHNWKLLAGAERPTGLPDSLAPSLIIRETISRCRRCGETLIRADHVWPMEGK